MPWKQIREISFAGCGVLNFYQAGVCERLLEEIPFNNIVFSGASAGAGMSIVVFGIPPVQSSTGQRELGQHPVGEASSSLGSSHRGRFYSRFLEAW